MVRHTLARNKATILVYHDPSPRVLDLHLSYLSRRYSFVELDRLVEALDRRDWSGLPMRSLVITLDDGHRGNLALLKVFQKHGLTPTIYLCSRIVATNRHFWFKTPQAQQAGRDGCPDPLRLGQMKSEYGFRPDRDYWPEERQALSRREILSMKDFVHFGSHSQFHPFLTGCGESEVRDEITGSKEDLERLLGRECCHFCYPKGDYGDREVELVKQSGYRSARTMDWGWNDCRSDPNRLRALWVSDTASVDLLAVQAAGLWSLNRPVRAFFSGKRQRRRPARKVGS